MTIGKKRAAGDDRIRDFDGLPTPPWATSYTTAPRRSIEANALGARESSSVGQQRAYYMLRLARKSSRPDAGCALKAARGSQVGKITSLLARWLRVDFASYAARRWGLHLIATSLTGWLQVGLSRWSITNSPGGYGSRSPIAIQQRPLSAKRRAGYELWPTTGKPPDRTSPSRSLRDGHLTAKGVITSKRTRNRSSPMGRALQPRGEAR